MQALGFNDYKMLLRVAKNGLFIMTKMDNPLATMESFNRQFQVGGKEREAVECGWREILGLTGGKDGVT